MCCTRIRLMTLMCWLDKFWYSDTIILLTPSSPIINNERNQDLRYNSELAKFWDYLARDNWANRYLHVSKWSLNPEDWSDEREENSHSVWNRIKRFSSFTFSVMSSKLLTQHYKWFYLLLMLFVVGEMWESPCFS